MAVDLRHLKARYLDACRNIEILPNGSILSSFCKAELKKSHQGVCDLEIILDRLPNDHLPPLTQAISQTSLSGIDAVDLHQESRGELPKGEIVLTLLDAVQKKLRFADLSAFEKDVLSFVSRNGLNCEILDMRFSPIQMLSMCGSFLRLHTLILDFSASLSSIKEGCFSCMPNLKRLSMCGTHISDLSLTSSVLSKLPSLVELRFQICLNQDDIGLFRIATASSHENRLGSKELSDLWAVESSSDNLSQRTTPAHLSDEHALTSDDFSHMQRLWTQSSSTQVLKDPIPGKFISYHPSPICFQRHYREFMITSLPRLKVLDNMLISNSEKEKSKMDFSKHYEYLPYNRQRKESIISIIHRRETGNSASFLSSRSLCAAKFGSNPWPQVDSLSKVKRIIDGERKSFRPRQFEYHPSDPSLMAFGTLDGELVAINHESGEIVSYLSSSGGAGSILGICWLRNHPFKLIAGSDRGALRLHDVHKVHGKFSNRVDERSFIDFDQLTSVHVNCMDECFIASGFSHHVALYDICSGRRLKIFKDLHREHINVVKFANHSPTVFASASFDQKVKLWDLRQEMTRPCYTTASSRGNVMVCFSHDDHYLLTSAIDNEVKQLLAVDGRVNLSFKTSPTGSAQNYTRSYYMNGRDYVISGSCEENVVRICCARTGVRLRDVSLEGRGRSSVFVQSLRGDPFRDFHMSVLAAHSNPRSKLEIMKINLVSSTDIHDGIACATDRCSSHGMGG